MLLLLLALKRCNCGRWTPVVDIICTRKSLPCSWNVLLHVRTTLKHSAKRYTIKLLTQVFVLKEQYVQKLTCSEPSVRVNQQLGLQSKLQRTHIDLLHSSVERWCCLCIKWLLRGIPKHSCPCFGEGKFLPPHSIDRVWAFCVGMGLSVLHGTRKVCSAQVMYVF